MSKILESINKFFPDGENFTPFDLSIKTGIDSKVCSMALKRLSNSLRIGYLREHNTYWDWGIEECNIRRKEWNDLVDKYGYGKKKELIIKK